MPSSIVTQYKEEDDLDAEFLRDNDSLYVLPLKFIPLNTSLLRRSRLVKTFSLETAVEVFRVSDQGRGYFLMEDLLKGDVSGLFSGASGHQAQLNSEMLVLLSSLHSYDIYNLHIKFRENNIEYKNSQYLQLSEEKKRELAVYKRQFTAPLIQTIFGGGVSDKHSASDIVDIFRDPNSIDAKRNLNRLSAKLCLETEEIPQFLEEFSDVYMAISYNKNYADVIDVMNSMFMRELDEIHKLLRWKSDPDVEMICNDTKEVMKSLFLEVYQRLDVFERETNSFWSDLNPGRFWDIRWLVRDSQAMIAGVLCGLGVKLSRWREKFPTINHGSSTIRYEAVRNEFRPGLKRLARLAAADVSEDETDDNGRVSRAS